MARRSGATCRPTSSTPSATWSGPTGSVSNATGLLIDAADGLRVINEVEQLAAFEWASCQTSQGVRSLLRGLRPGMTEHEAVRLLGWNGWPLSCHLMLTAGPRATFGLLSPGDRPIQRGDRFTTAFGIWGALTCRAGFVVESADELPEPIRDYVDRLVAPYFAAIAEWYATIRIGVTGGQLHEIVERHLGDPFFGIFLNPGHQLHLDEWINSPIWAGSPIQLRSGMCFQVDVIPATGTEYFTTNIEDGIALADEPMRADLAARFPDAWRRIELTTRLHGRVARDRAPSGCPAVLEPARRPVAVPPRPGSGHDAGPMTAVEQIVLRGDGVELVVLPGIGARIHRLRVDGADLLRTPVDPATHRDDPFFWGAYLMAPWCNRAPAQPFDRGRADGAAGAELPRWIGDPWARPRSALGDSRRWVAADRCGRRRGRMAVGLRGDRPPRRSPAGPWRSTTS